ncbi:hypothetical protein [Thermoanaerobacterium thermosulfurigenes]|uniref:hypothetical protein n=1 Tax=Thermoanaerobacterium thermosulfurigenes TaxID=33950 RepID=UPI003EFA382E
MEINEIFEGVEEVIKNLDDMYILSGGSEELMREEDRIAYAQEMAKLKLYLIATSQFLAEMNDVADYWINKYLFKQ